MEDHSKKKLPDTNRIPQNLEGMKFIPISQYSVNSYCALPDGKGKPSQVHLVLETPEKLPIILRLKSKDAMDTFIQALERHRNDVWPGA